MMVQQKVWDRTKAEIEYNVAHRPLLMELQSQSFRGDLAEMWQIENFVQILWEAKLAPENVLNDKQKQILASAEYFENLNSSTAYFPSVPLDNLQWEQAPETYEGEEEEVEGEGDAANDGQIPPV